MFELDPSLDRIPVSPDTIERVAWSLNLTPVAGADFAGAEARAYAVTAAGGGGRSECYVCMYVSSLDRAQVYRHRANPFPASEGEAHEEEALAFLEELGFILESIDYRGWSGRERQEWFEKQPPFQARRATPQTPPLPAEPAVAAQVTATADVPPPPTPEKPAEMEGLMVLADTTAGPWPTPSPRLRQARRGEAPARAEAAAQASPPPEEGPQPAPPRPGPVKVDLPEEYGDLGRLFASL